MTVPAAVSASRGEVRTVAPRPTLTETPVYPDTWERPGLSKRDRRLITVAALMALYRPDHLEGHTERALASGVTREEIGELITHPAFYAGWPSAMSTAKVVKQVLQEKRA
jgi:4-carboxymuconolactone decarboxylase